MSLISLYPYNSVLLTVQLTSVKILFPPIPSASAFLFELCNVSEYRHTRYNTILCITSLTPGLVTMNAGFIQDYFAMSPITTDAFLPTTCLTVYRVTRYYMTLRFHFAPLKRKLQENHMVNL